MSNINARIRKRKEEEAIKIPMKLGIFRVGVLRYISRWSIFVRYSDESYTSRKSFFISFSQVHEEVCVRRVT